jgi:hypothetical protein
MPAVIARTRSHPSKARGRLRESSAHDRVPAAAIHMQPPRDHKLLNAYRPGTALAAAPRSHARACARRRSIAQHRHCTCSVRETHVQADLIVDGGRRHAARRPGAPAAPGTTVRPRSKRLTLRGITSSATAQPPEFHDRRYSRAAWPLKAVRDIMRTAVQELGLHRIQAETPLHNRQRTRRSDR